MDKKKISRSKNYNNLRMFLERVHRIKNSGSLSHFLIEKFSSSSHPTHYVKIFVEELRQAGVLSKDEKMYEWREEMCKKQILICKADEETIKDKNANYKAAEFKFGSSIKKYMEIAIIEKSSLLERIDNNNKGSNDRIDALERQVQLMIELVLEALPPDTPARQKIAREFYGDKKACVAALKEEKRSAKKKSDESKKNTELRIVC